MEIVQGIQMRLEEIGFYTLTDARAIKTSMVSPLWRCELLVTSRCNFKCPYCRGMNSEDQGDISWKNALKILILWCEEKLKNIRFSGGEPTMWKYLIRAVRFVKQNEVERIAISTNGSADLDLYLELIDAGVNDISISLDSCCSSIGNKMAGDMPVWDIVVSNIENLSKLTYVTVGIVLTQDNISESDKIIQFAQDLGVADIRIIPTTQNNKHLPSLNCKMEEFPILSYRLKNIEKGRDVRGILMNDNHQCLLVLDDMVVLNEKHYPCIIYLREGGNKIGRIGSTMRWDRFNWAKNHNSYEDNICRKNCLDVCIDYNNQAKKLGNCILS